MTADPVAVRQFLDRVETAARNAGLSHPRTNATQVTNTDPAMWNVIAYADVANSNAGFGILMHDGMFTDPAQSAKALDELLPGLCRRVATCN